MTDPISAYLQSRSSDKAASEQKDSAQAGQDTQWKMYDQTRQDQMPWLTQGKTSLEQLGGMMGQGGALNQRYQQFQPYQQFKPMATSNYEKFKPMATSNYEKFKPMTMADFQADPSYNFRRNEGIRGIENSMAGRSSFGGGNMLKALSRYNSGLASTEYGAANDRFNQNFATGYNQFNQDQNAAYDRHNKDFATSYDQFNQDQNNAYNRYNQDFQTAYNQHNQDYTTGYNQFNQDQNTTYNRLAALSGVGQTTATNLGSVGQNTANAVSQGQSDYGDAAARRYMGRAGVYKGINDDNMKIAGMLFGGG